MTAAAQSPWLIPGPHPVVTRASCIKAQNVFELVSQSWGKRLAEASLSWQYILVCVAAFLWVQLITCCCLRWIAIYGKRVARVSNNLMKPAVPHSRLSKIVLNRPHPHVSSGQRSCRHLCALVLMCILHSGEAANPGPPKQSEWTLGVCNPSGLNGKQQIINDHLGFGDTWLIAETHLSSSAMQAFKAGLWTTDSAYRYCVGGHPCPLRPHSEHAGSWSGISVLSKHPTRSIPIAVDPDLIRSSRIQFTTTLCHDLWISGATIYGEPPGSAHPNAGDHTDVLIQTAIDSISLMPGLRFIGGDFNFELGSLECFERLEKLGFLDVQSIAEIRWGIAPKPTCKGSTRKDFLFISPEMQQLLVSVSVIHFGGHCASIEIPVWRTPQQIEWPKEFQLNHPLQVTFENQDPSEAYTALWTEIEASVVNQAQESPAPVRKAQLGRGQTFQTHVRKGFLPPRHLKPSRKGDIQPKYEGTNAQHSQWFRQLRRLQAYCRFKKAYPIDTDNAHGAALWRSVIHAKGFQRNFPDWWEHQCGTLLFGAPASVPLIPPPLDMAELIYNSLTIEVRSLENKLRASRQAKLRQQRTEMAHMVFRDCKPDPPDRVDLFVAHKQSKVISVDHDEQAIHIEPVMQFEQNTTCHINGKETWVLNADPNLIHLDDVDSISPGDSIVQTPFTGKLEDLFDAFNREWSARWNRHLDVPSSQWDQILEFSQRLSATCLPKD